MMVAGLAFADQPFGDTNPAIYEDTTGFIIEAPSNDQLDRMVVEVFNNEGLSIVTQESLGEPLVVDPGPAMPDGRYVFVVRTMIKVDPELQSSLMGNPEFIVGETRSVFYVIDGRKVSDEEYIKHMTNSQAAADDHKSIDWLLSLAGGIVGFLVPSAHATDVTISDSTPELNYDDTDDNLDGGVERDWSIFANGGPTSGFYRIRNNVGADTSTNVILIDGDSTGSHTTQNNSIWIQESGNIELLNSGAVFDRSSTQLVIGSIVPTFDTGSLVDLELKDIQPYFVMTDTDAGTGMGQYVQGNMFWFESSLSLLGFPNPVGIDVRAPESSLIITESGTVSLAAGNAIHVGSTATPVGQFTITSPVQPRFEMNDTTTGKRWRFSVASDKFAVNNLDVAGTEFQVFDNGDVLITGALTQNSDVNAKQDIVPVDRHDVLARIAALPIAEWSYKDAPGQRHVGPMAQDFYAAFGLGRNEKGISTLDSSGVALAGIQALAEDNAAIRAQNEALLEQNAKLSERLADLERQQAETQAMMARLLEAQQAQPVLTRSLAN
jgi:hypothetical protein